MRSEELRLRHSVVLTSDWSVFLKLCRDVNKSNKIIINIEIKISITQFMSLMFYSRVCSTYVKLQAVLPNDDGNVEVIGFQGYRHYRQDIVLKTEKFFDRIFYCHRISQSCRAV